MTCTDGWVCIVHAHYESQLHSGSMQAHPLTGAVIGKAYLKATKHIHNNDEIFVNCGSDFDVMMGWKKRIIVSNVDGKDAIDYVAVP